MKGLVLAAGRGERIATVALGRPKPLLEVAGRSLLEWNLRWLASQGVNEIWVNLHYGADEIQESVEVVVGDHGGRNDPGSSLPSLRFSREPVLLGTAGAWKALAVEWTETSLVVYGDNLMRFDVGRLIARHRERAALCTVALFDPGSHCNTGGAGGRAWSDDDGRITSFVERGGPVADGARGVNAGVYVLEPAVLRYTGPGFQDFGHDVLPRLAADGVLYGEMIEAGGFCLGLDTPERYALAQSLVATGVVSL